MTWSIIARDEATGCFGIAVATRFLAVGARVPFIAARSGAVASQALVNPSYGTNGLAAARGPLAAEVVDALLPPTWAATSGRFTSWTRQVASPRIAAPPASRGPATSTGSTFRRRQHAGGAAVLDQTPPPTALTPASLPCRLIAAMQAGEAAGGDKRGKQSAALLIYGEDDWSDLDLRVDDHADPLTELARIERLSREHWTVFRHFMPPSPITIGATGCSVSEIASARTRAGLAKWARRSG